MTFGSLFSGAGGLDLGLERAGMRCIWQCESDPFARRVLARHWPGIHCYLDVRDIDDRVERPRVLCGGFPCQDNSLANHRGKGLDGGRSGLWSEFDRLIRLFRPDYVVVENVPGLFSRGFGRVLGSLAAIGYDAEWSVVPACALGAPHPRERLFVLGYPQRHAAGPDEAASQEKKRWGLSDDRGGLERLGRAWAREPDVARVAYGVPHLLDRRRCLGNAVPPPVGDFIGRLILAVDHGF